MPEAQVYAPGLLHRALAQEDRGTSREGPQINARRMPCGILIAFWLMLLMALWRQAFPSTLSLARASLNSASLNGKGAVRARSGHGQGNGQGTVMACK